MIASRKSLVAVYKGYLGYIAATMAFHFFGPWTYRDENYWAIIGFMSVFLLLTYLGYSRGSTSACPISRSSSLVKRVCGGPALSVVLLVAAVLKWAIFADNLLSRETASLSSALADPGAVYSDALARAREISETSILGQIETLLGVVTLVAIVVGLYRYDELKRPDRWLLRALLVAIVLNGAMFRGTQIVFGALATYWLTARSLRRLRQKRRLLDWKFVTSCVSALLLFGFVQASRLSTYGVTSASRASVSPLLTLDEGHWWFSLLGKRIGLAGAVLGQYGSMGYYGLGLCLEQPFVWTAGLGSSFAISAYAEQYLGIPSQLDRTYPLRVEAERGWPALMYWQTAFPWLASDLSWMGALVLMAVLGYVYAVALREVILRDNVLSLLVVANLTVMWLFVPANNQLMQTRESAITTILVMVAWVGWHRRFNTRAYGSALAGVQRSAR